MVTEKLTSTHFADNFWESIDRNGITILIERMKGAKQTCERFRHAYEARALLEEEYGKTLLQISQKQKSSNTENGASKIAMDSMQTEFLSVAESHLHLSTLLRETIALPLTNLLNKQKILRKQLQASIQKLYNNRQIQVHFVRRAHKRHNLEIEKANLLVQQQTTDEEKRAVFESAQITIDKLKTVYDEAVKDLERIVEDWNVEWRNTCEIFEKLEQERLEFFKTNLSNCANLIIGSLQNEIQACERVNEQAIKIDVYEDLKEFVVLNKSSQRAPTPMEYIKLHAYQEANQDIEGSKMNRNVIDNEEQSESEDRAQVRIRRKRLSISSTVSEESISMTSKNNILKSAAEAAAAAEAALLEKQKAEKETSTEPVLMRGIMEVYPSDEEEDDDDEYEYVTETEIESEGEGEAEEHEERMEAASVQDKKQLENKTSSKDYNNQELNEDPSSVDDNNKNKENLDLKEGDTLEQQDQSNTILVKKEDVKETDNQYKADMDTQSKNETINEPLFIYQKDIKEEEQQSTLPSSLTNQDDLVSKRRVSFVENPNSPAPIQSAETFVSSPHSLSKNHVTKVIDPITTQNQFKSDKHSENDQQESLVDEEETFDYDNSTRAAVFELDDMLRELDSKRIDRDYEDSTRYHHSSQIKPTASLSSPSYLQRQNQRRSYIPSQYLNKQYPTSRRMSTVESAKPQYVYNNNATSIRSSADLYDPFNSLSTKETGSTLSSRDSSSTGSSIKPQQTTTPTAQMIHDRMLTHHEDTKQHQMNHGSVSSSSSDSLRSIDQQSPFYRNNKFVQDFYSINSKTSSPSSSILSNKDGHFIDFAVALYDYEASDEGEIGFKEGDLLGIISKSENDEQGWWEASLLNSRNQKIVRTGLVPSNFLETASK
ncbi:uncharacterized protein BX663DRAFT_512395 [Cokeromyces recurvatus]|uniref:uncharacterized protein n=1 Tax=Cokeromyces recurvatus TaxID=90255 RepID=UPI0022202FEE|nr:uncharacterized protein BX663DRAFT_512395 [Cokeromyces recurvatus]KAI7901779.1 hypothetical protein BX663DRAFT_512395 [Cokeromyces recurvatus]